MKSSWIVFTVVLLGCVLDNTPCEGSKKYNRYLAHIFNKYGSGGTMSFEGLEHLMHSLGLGALEFNPTHTIEEHHPDGYKLPDLILDDDDLAEDNDLQNNEKYDNERMEVKELEPSQAAQVMNELSNLNNFDTTTTEDRNMPSFKEMHDPKHRHPRHHADPESGNKCLSPKSLMKLVIDSDDIYNDKKLNYNVDFERSRRYADEINTDKNEDEAYTQLLSSLKITPISFMKMCPALLVQIDQDACAKPIILEDAFDPESYFYAWIYASIAIFIISSCGLVGVAIVPLAKSVAYDEILKFLVAIAVGTLCGDALMHLLPHAMGGGHDKGAAEENDHESGHNNEPVWLCACAFVTCLFMYALETLLPLLRGSNGHNHGHSHHHDHVTSTEYAATNIDMEIISKQSQQQQPDAKELNIMLDEQKLDKKSIKLSPVAFMVILGDGLHNITDGLAIGAAFAGDPVTGMATALAVLCHELPHELGDFALLLQTGVNIRRAIFLNIVSSILSFMGMAAGLLVAGIHSGMTRWIYASTAGSFLYIALSDLIPEMNRSGKQDLKNCLIQILGMLFGGGIMMIIALNEDSLKMLFE